MIKKYARFLSRVMCTWLLLVHAASGFGMLGRLATGIGRKVGGELLTNKRVWNKAGQYLATKGFGGLGEGMQLPGLPTEGEIGPIEATESGGEPPKILTSKEIFELNNQFVSQISDSSVPDADIALVFQNNPNLVKAYQDYADGIEEANEKLSWEERTRQKEPQDWYRTEYLPAVYEALIEAQQQEALEAQKTIEQESQVQKSESLQPPTPPVPEVSVKKPIETTEIAQKKPEVQPEKKIESGLQEIEENLKKEIQSLRQKNQDLEQKNREVLQDTRSLIKRVRTQQQELKTTKTQLEKAIEEANVLKNQLEEQMRLTEDSQLFKKENERLSMNVNVLRAEIAKLKAANAQLQAVQSRPKGDISAQNLRLEHDQILKRMEKRHAEEMQEQVNRSDQEVAQKQTELEQSEKREEKLREQLRAEQIRYQDLQTLFEQLKQKQTDLASARENTAQTIKKSQEKINEITKQHAEEKTRLEGVITRQSSEITRLDSLNKTSKRQFSTLLDQQTVLKDRLVDIGVENKGLKAQNETLLVFRNNAQRKQLANDVKKDRAFLMLTQANGEKSILNLANPKTKKAIVKLIKKGGIALLVDISGREFSLNLNDIQTIESFTESEMRQEVERAETGQTSPDGEPPMQLMPDEIATLKSLLVQAQGEEIELARKAEQMKQQAQEDAAQIRSKADQYRQNAMSEADADREVARKLRLEVEKLEQEAEIAKNEAKEAQRNADTVKAQLNDEILAAQQAKNVAESEIGVQSKELLEAARKEAENFLNQAKEKAQKEASKIVDLANISAKHMVDVGNDTAIKLMNQAGDKFGEANETKKAAEKLRKEAEEERNAAQKIREDLQQNALKMRNDANAEAENIKNAANQEAELIKNQANTEANQIKNTAQQDAEGIKNAADQEAQQIKSQANTEANQIKNIAQQDAEGIKSAADQEAEQIKNQANTEAKNLKDEAQRLLTEAQQEFDQAQKGQREIEQKQLEFAQKEKELTNQKELLDARDAAENDELLALQNQVPGLTAEVEAQKMRAEQAEKNITNIGNENQQLRDSLANKNQQINELAQKEQNLTQQLEGETQRADAAGVRIFTLEGELQAKGQALQVSNERILVLEGEVQQGADALVQKDQQINQLTQDMQNVRNQIAEKEVNVQELQNEIEQQIQRTETAEEGKLVAENQVQNLTQQLGGVTERANAADVRILALEDELQVERQALQEKNEEIANLQQEIQNRADALVQRDEQINRLTLETQNLTNQIVEKNAALQALQEGIVQQTQRADMATARVLELEGEIREVRQALQVRDERVLALDREVQGARQALQEGNEKILALEEAKNLAMQRADDAELELENLKRKHSIKLNELNNEIAKLETQRNILQNDVLNYEKQLAQRREEAPRKEEPKEDLLGKQKQIDDLTSKINQLNEGRQYLDARHQREMDQLRRSFADQLTRKDSEVERERMNTGLLADQIKDLLDKNSDLQKQNRDLIDELNKAVQKTPSTTARSARSASQSPSKGWLPVDSSAKKTKFPVRKNIGGETEKIGYPPFEIPKFGPSIQDQLKPSIESPEPQAIQPLLRKPQPQRSSPKGGQIPSSSAQSEGMPVLGDVKPTSVDKKGELGKSSQEGYEKDKQESVTTKPYSGIESPEATGSDRFILPGLTKESGPSLQKTPAEKAVIRGPEGGRGRTMGREPKGGGLGAEKSEKPSATKKSKPSFDDFFGEDYEDIDMSDEQLDAESHSQLIEPTRRKVGEDVPESKKTPALK